MEIEFQYVKSRLGQLHIATAGEGFSLILLHQTPRSWDEFRELIPLLAPHYRVIAMDMYGFGQSAKYPKPHTIEKFSEGVIALADALGIDKFHLMGHHTGAIVSFETAAKNPSRIAKLVMSASPFTDAAYREAHKEGDGVDDAEISEDGRHLMENWAKRYAFYPKGKPDILNRFIHDTLNFGVDPKEGHKACARYVIEDKFDLITHDVLLIAPTEDPFAFPQIEKFQRSLTKTKSLQTAVIEGGMIPLMEEKSPEVAEAVLKFLNS